MGQGLEFSGSKSATSCAVRGRSITDFQSTSASSAATAVLSAASAAKSVRSTATRSVAAGHPAPADANGADARTCAVRATATSASVSAATTGTHASRCCQQPYRADRGRRQASLCLLNATAQEAARRRAPDEPLWQKQRARRPAIGECPSGGLSATAAVLVETPSSRQRVQQQWFRFCVRRTVSADLLSAARPPS